MIRGQSSSKPSDMVTMNSEKATAKRKQEPTVRGCSGQINDESVITSSQSSSAEDSPNILLYKKVNSL